jgi:DNA-binding MarR family transcriptional regulator
MTNRDWASLTGRPGFLIRRLHQIHLALFAEECGRFGVTPVQFSLLSVVASRPGLDQSALALEVGVELIYLTPAGRRMLVRMNGAAQRAHERTLGGLPARDRDRFVAFLAQLVDSGNEHGRAPMRLGGD